MGDEDEREAGEEGEEFLEGGLQRPHLRVSEESFGIARHRLD